MRRRGSRRASRPSPANAAIGGGATEPTAPARPSVRTLGGSNLGSRVVPWIVVLALIALAMVIRLPIFFNAWADFNSDEAVNALVIRHLLERGEVTLYNWDATYYGIVEGLIAVPFVWLIGFEPLAFRLAAACGLALLMAAVFVLGRRLFGTAAGLVAAACLTVFSPQVVQWSTLASVGFLLTIAWGALSLVVLDELRRRQTWPWVALLGFILGFGLYMYELFLVYLALFVVAGLLGSSFVAVVRTTPLRAAAWRRSLRQLPGAVHRWIVFAAAFAVGWSPKLAALVQGTVGTKRPLYTVASAERILAQVDRLITECVPAFFGVNPAGDPDVASAIGPVAALDRVLGALLLVLMVAAWSASAFRRRRDLLAVLLLRPVRLEIESLLVMLVPVTALAFVLSPNPQDVLSNRYLLPWLTSLPVLVGAWAVGQWRRHPAWGAALLALILGLPAVQTESFFRSRGFLNAGLEIARTGDNLKRLLTHVEEEGIQGGFASYWLAYKLTMLSGEQLVLTPIQDWSRYPPYERFVARLDDPAFIFHEHEPHHQNFIRRLEASGRTAQTAQVGPYRVYTSPDDRPLFLSDSVHLRRHRAQIVVVSPPDSAAPGELFSVPLRIRNTGDVHWLASGPFPVDVAYRWFDEQGRTVVANGERTLLPEDVAPAEWVEVAAVVEAPPEEGRFHLMLTLVHEGVDWFDAASGSRTILSISVEDDPSGTRPAAAGAPK